MNINNYRISIVCVGKVGEAIYDGLKQKKCNVIGYDKYKNINKFEDILNTDIAFLPGILKIVNVKVINFLLFK